MRKSVTEWIGSLLSWPLGILMATASFLRHSRVFHPRGILFMARVETLPGTDLAIHPYALIRFSSGWWKQKEWPDILGVAIRFSANPQFHVTPRKSDQDLLFASFKTVPQLLIGPLITKYKDYLANDYYSVLPSSTPHNQKTFFKLKPIHFSINEESRNISIQKAVKRHQAVLLLQMKGQHENWKDLAHLVIEQKLELDQESLRFYPFHMGLGIIPRGFLQHLRIGTYQLSQWARPKEASAQP